MTSKVMPEKVPEVEARGRTDEALREREGGREGGREGERERERFMTT